MKVFGYPEFDGKGEMIITEYTGDYAHGLCDIRMYKMKAGDTKVFEKDGEEIAVLLLSGEVTFTFDGQEKTVSRESVFTEGPWAVHASTGYSIGVKAVKDTEICVTCTKNDKKFGAKIYSPDDAPWGYSTVGKFGNVAKRRVNTIFDIDIQPESNMVLGEVLNDKGNWSGYLPHAHPQPETYIFLFDHPEGFGASFVGDEVFKSVDHSFSCIPGGKTHPQAVAPGYQMYTIWIIRHLDGEPWHQYDRNEDPRYVWLHDVKD